MTSQRVTSGVVEYPENLHYTQVQCTCSFEEFCYRASPKYFCTTLHVLKDPMAAWSCPMKQSAAPTAINIQHKLANDASTRKHCLPLVWNNQIRKHWLSVLFLQKIAYFMTTTKQLQNGANPYIINCSLLPRGGTQSWRNCRSSSVSSPQSIPPLTSDYTSLFTRGWGGVLLPVRPTASVQGNF